MRSWFSGSFSLCILLSVWSSSLPLKLCPVCGGLSPEVPDTLTHTRVPELLTVRLEVAVVGTQS